jgi:dienelactone hydrolase
MFTRLASELLDNGESGAGLGGFCYGSGINLQLASHFCIHWMADCDCDLTWYGSDGTVCSHALDHLMCYNIH